MQSWRDVQKDFLTVWSRWCSNLCVLVLQEMRESPPCKSVPLSITRMFRAVSSPILGSPAPKAFPWGQSSFENTQTNTRQPREEPQAVKSNWLSWKRENKLSDAGNTIEFGDQLFLKCFSTSYSRTGWRWRQNMRSRPKLSVDQLLELTANVEGGALACTSAHREVLLGLVLAPIGFAALTQVKRKQ